MLNNEPTPDGPPEDFRSLLTRAEAAERGLEYPVLSWDATPPVSHITDDMVQRGARAVVGTIFRDEFEDSHNKHIDLARAVLSAALAGCTVVPDSVPTGESVDGERYWWTALSTITNGLNLADKPFVRIDGEFFNVDEVEADALARLTAAREARRLAGEQHG